MIRKAIHLSILIFISVLLFTGCADSVQESDIVDKTYVYEKDGFGGEFVITINGDGTFSYYEGALSSYMATGKWTLEEDTLQLSDDEDMGSSLVNYFKVDGNDLIYLSENSSNFLYVQVADGDIFSGKSD